MKRVVIDKIKNIDFWVESHLITRFLLSNTALAFFYGVFLLLYEIRFLRELIPTLHPFLIAWACGILVYNLFVRGLLRKLVGSRLMCIFALVAGITALINYDAGITSNVKGWILVVLPMFTFFSVSILQSKAERSRSIVIALSGAMSVIFVASAIALITYFLRISEVVSFMGMEELVGFRYYMTNDPTSGGMILFGVYVDTNHAAIYALVSAAFSVYLINYCKQVKEMNLITRIIVTAFAVINILVQICYFPLANSRGAWICLYCAGILCCFMYFFYSCFNNQKGVVRLCKSVVLGVALVVVFGSSVTYLRNGLSELSIYIENSVNSQGDDTIDQNIVEESAGLETDKVEEEAIVEEGAGLETDKVEEEAIVEESDGLEIDKVEEEATYENQEIVVDAPNQEQATRDNFSKPDDGSGAGRLSIWKDAIGLFKVKPLFGTAPSNNQYYAIKHNVALEKMGNGYAIHNSYLDLLVDYGLIGTLAMVCFWCYILFKIFEYIKNQKYKKDFGFYSIIFSVLVIGGGSAFLSCLFITTTAMYYLLLIMTGYLVSCIND